MRYYGCKTKLLDYIDDAITSLKIKDGAIIFDIFSGTSAVGQHFKQLGYTIYANDFLEFAYALAKSYIEINDIPEFQGLKKEIGEINSPKDVIDYLNSLKLEAGFITANYSPYKKSVRQYLSVENAMRVDSIRKTIHIWKTKKLINGLEYYFLITSLLNAINLRSNVTGTYAAYLKTWDSRALKPLILETPQIIKSTRKNLAFKADANKIISKYNVDVLYLDPPYNTRQFASNYFFLELIAEGWFEKDQKIYGVTGMREYSHQKSDYSLRQKAAKALLDLVTKAKAKYIIMSYNNEGIIPLDELKEILKTRGRIQEYRKQHKRYRSINQDGSNTSTHELLFVVKVKQ